MTDWSQLYWSVRNGIKRAREQAVELRGVSERDEDKRKVALVVTKLDEARLWLEDIGQ